MNRKLLSWAIALLLAAPAAWGQQPAAPAADVASVTVLKLIELLVEQGVISRDKAQELIRQAEREAKAALDRAAQGAVVAGGASGAAAAGAAPGAAPGSVRVPYVPQVVREEIKEELRQEILAQARNERWGEPDALPSWLGRFTFEGDLRVRGQMERYDEGNAPATFYQAQTQGPASGVDLSNTTEDRNRGTLRARLGVRARITDEWSGGLRITTGSLTGPASTSQTLGGGSGYFNKYDVVLDRAFIRWNPRLDVEASAGRIPNPWFTTDLIYSEDLNFDGVAFSYKPFPTAAAPVQPFVTVGAFVVDENELSDDRWLYAAQGGIVWEPNATTQLKVGAAVYDFTNVEGIAALPGSRGSPTYGATEYPRGTRSKGNILFNIGDPLSTDVIWGLASKFRPVALTGALELANYDPVRIALTGEYVVNTAFDENDIFDRTGFRLAKQNRGYQGRVAVGMPGMREQRDWLLFLAYRKLERDAVLDAFTDTTWHLGGTNYRGWQLGGSYAVDRNVWLGLRWTSTDEVSGPPLAIDVLQLDLNARF
jgi:hypothetical protein